MTNHLDINSLDNDFFKFIESHKLKSSASLLLSMKGKNNDFPLDFAVTQIECRKKTTSKLKPFIQNSRFLFPDSIISEQSTDYRVSRLHASIIGKGVKILDMTAGLGIDAMTFASRGNNVLAIELDRRRYDTLKYNAGIFNLFNLRCLNTDSIDYLKNTDETYDVIFIDPARRDDTNQRVYGFSDCRPDILANMDILKKHADLIYIKASPMLDIKQVTRELHGVSEIFITCVKGECKEILPVVKKDGVFSCIRIIDLDDNGIISDIAIEKNYLDTDGDYDLATKDHLLPGSFLYIPNSGVMKVNASTYLCNKFKGLKKISNNTHIYISKEFFSDFPGAIFKLICLPEKKALKKLSGASYNVTTRNYPVKAEDLKKKLRVKDGIDDFIIGFRAFKDEIPVLCIAKRLNRNIEAKSG